MNQHLIICTRRGQPLPLKLDGIRQGAVQEGESPGSWLIAEERRDLLELPSNAAGRQGRVLREAIPQLWPADPPGIPIAPAQAHQ